MATATDHIHGEVRELIRRRGLDPVADPRSARNLIDEVMNHYEERVSTSSLPPMLHRHSVTREIFDAVAGFGPLQRFLDDDEVEEIWVNQPGQVFVARNGRSELTTTMLGSAEIRDLVERMLNRLGDGWICRHPLWTRCFPTGAACMR
jgi:pilus assembly protein CpaF